VRTILWSFSFAIWANGNARKIFNVISYSPKILPNYDDFRLWTFYQKTDEKLRFFLVLKTIFIISSLTRTVRNIHIFFFIFLYIFLEYPRKNKLNFIYVISHRRLFGKTKNTCKTICWTQCLTLLREWILIILNGKLSCFDKYLMSHLSMS